MRIHFIVQCYSLLLFFLVYSADFTYSNKHYIRPTHDSLCPKNISSCLTLSQFVANSSHNETDTTLLFLPGNHTLSQELTLTDRHNFSMTKYAQDNEQTVFVECANHMGRFDISVVTSVSINGLHFVGCGNNSVSQAMQLTIEDVIFQSVKDKSMVLVINDVDNANVVRSSFMHNTLKNHDTTIPSLSQDELEEYVYHQQDVTGVLYITASSNVSVVDSRFMHNRAHTGGALVAHDSIVYIVRSTYGYNTANFGGAMVTSGSEISIDDSTFSMNSAQHSGGVIVAYNDRFNISNTNFTNNTADRYAGVMATSGNASFNIRNSNFTSNSAENGGGGVMATSGYSSFTITNSAFTSNVGTKSAGVMRTLDYSLFAINKSTFTHNTGSYGIMVTFHNSLFTINNSSFISNNGTSGGVMRTTGNSNFTITNTAFTSNSGISGVMDTAENSIFTISNSNFTSNSGRNDGSGVMTTSRAYSFTISNSNFTSNRASDGAGVMTLQHSSFNITDCSFTNNSAFNHGVMKIYNVSFTTSNTNFTFNSGNTSGVMEASSSFLFIMNSKFSFNIGTKRSVLVISQFSNFTIINTSFTSNTATQGNIMETIGSNTLVSIGNSIFANNTANSIGSIIRCLDGKLSISGGNFISNEVEKRGEGIIFISQCSTDIAESIFSKNLGSIYTFNSNLTFSGDLTFESGEEPTSAGNESTSQEGGVITSFQSTVIFARGCSANFTNNTARNGGAILAIESTFLMYGQTTITNNDISAIANSSGGGISLKQSSFEIRGNCDILNNSAVRGAGIHAASSTIAVHQPGKLMLAWNNAEFGGGMYLETNSKLYILKRKRQLSLTNDKYYLNFTSNHANYGGAVYVSDYTNSGTCSPDNECFIQTIALHLNTHENLNTINILFSENTASNLFGGLMDRCIPSPFAEVYSKQRIHYSGITYLENISNINRPFHSISSQPVRVCFCNSDTENEPDCSYQFQTISAKKGEAFKVSVVAVDQVNSPMDANITTVISSSSGAGFSEGQQTQSVNSSCRNLTYNVISPHTYETMKLFADGPCESAVLSTIQVTIQFTDCTCPVGFEPRSKEKSPTRCECICDSELPPDITNCDYTNSSVIRVNTNYWITYTNDTDPPGFIKYTNCPFDYCVLSTENVSMNFNLLNGADTQCAYNRTGILCGTCSGNASVSLASSRCLPCRSHWPAVCAVILISAIIAGILLVAALLALNMTVSVGLINGFIFYANIVSAGSGVFFPSSEPSFPSVFIAWLNLDIGIDVCFINGLDTYIKTWLQLAFPLYIISLVIMVILISAYSPRFAGLIAKRDPISTLATLILLSYAKMLSVMITALSFAVLEYPDGKREMVWLPDGSIKYFRGKHIPLALVALLIIFIGLPFTILLFLWQWIARAPRWKIFNWTRRTRLNIFIATYHIPHNSKHRYWTGLLLLVRVVLYVTASVTVSSNPQTFPLMTVILIGGMILFKGLFGLRVYKNLFVDIVDTVLYFNLHALAAFTLYEFKKNVSKQTAVAYTSTIITLILFIGSICYHVCLVIKKDKPSEESNEYPLAPVQPSNAEVTHSVIELPKPDQDRPQDTDRDETQISEARRIITPPYITAMQQ